MLELLYALIGAGVLTGTSASLYRYSRRRRLNIPITDAYEKLRKILYPETNIDSDYPDLLDEAVDALETVRPRLERLGYSIPDSWDDGDELEEWFEFLDREHRRLRRPWWLP